MDSVTVVCLSHDMKTVVIHAINILLLKVVICMSIDSNIGCHNIP